VERIRLFAFDETTRDHLTAGLASQERKNSRW
jgi:hypothetical protein